MKTRNAKIIAMAMLLVVGMHSAQAVSTNLFWSGNGTTQGGSGTWDTSSARWGTVASGPFSAMWNNANNDIAIFGGTAGTVTNQGVTVGGLTFITANYILTNSTITLGVAGTVSNAVTATITSALAGTGPLTKTGVGTLTMINTGNSYSGGTVINGGVLQVGASDGILGAAGSSITLNNNGQLKIPGVNLSSVRDVVVDAGGGSIAVNGNNNFTTTGKLTGSGTLTFGPVTGAGGQTLNFNATNNDFTGPIRVPSNYPVISFNSLPDSTNNIVFNGPNGGTFTWGSGAIAPLVLNNRTLQFDCGTAQTLAINNNASAANTLTINTSLSATGAGAKTLKLAGSNTGINVFAGSITNSPGGGTTAVWVGDGSSSGGIWALSGTNTYSGQTKVGSDGSGQNVYGTLIFRGKQAVSPNSALLQGQFSSQNGSFKFLDDSGGLVTLPNTLTLYQGNAVRGYYIFVGNNSTANGGNNPGSTTTGEIIAIQNLVLSQSGTGVPLGWASIQGANGYRLQINNVTIPASNNAGTLFNPTTTSVTLGTIQQATGNTGLQHTLTLDGTSSSNVVTGAIKDATDTGNSNWKPLQLTKSNMSTWTLSGTNTYSGGTTISGGKLVYSGDSSLPAAGTNAVGAAGHLSLADGTAQSFTISALTLASGATLSFDWNGASSGDQLTSTADITPAANSIFPVSISRSGSPSGSVTLLTGGAGSTLSSSKFYLVNMTNYTAALTVSPTTVSIGSYADVSPLSTFYWQGNKVAGSSLPGVDNAWALSSGTAGNWSTTTPSYTATGLVPGSGADVVFATGQTGKAQQSTVLGADVTVNSVTIDDAITVTIAGGTQNNALTLLSSSDVAGTVSAPGSAISVTANAANPTISSAINLGADQTWHVAAGKTLTVSGAVAGNYSLAKASSGTLTLSGANTYSGDTTINGGTLYVGSNSAGTLGNGNYAGNIFITNGATLAIWSTANQTLRGIISGDGNLTKAYGGTLTIPGTNNTYTGKTSIVPQTTAGCTVNISSFNSVFTDPVLGTVHSASSSLGAPTNVVNGTIQLGNGTAQASCTLKYTGPGETTDRIINVVFNGTDTQTIDASGTGLLKFTSPFTVTLSSGSRELILSGTGSGELVGGLPTLTAAGLSKSGTGTWTLSGTNVYVRPTAVTAGTLVIGGSGVLGGSGTYTNNIPISSGATFAYNSSAAQTFSGIISGAGTLVKNGTGTLTLSGTNTYSGATTVGSGTLTVVAGGNCTNSAVTVATAAALGVSVTNNTQLWSCASLALNNGSQVRYSFGVTPSESVAPLNITGNLTFSGTPEIVVGPASLKPGTYPLLTLGGTALTALPTLSGVNGKLEWGGSGKTLLLIVRAAGTLISIY